MSMFNGFFASRKESLIQILLIIGTIFFLNIAANSVVMRLDITSDKLYTLSEASKDIAANIQNPVNVTAYFTSNLPPEIQNTQEQFRYFLEEFRAHSHGNIEYSFVDPSADRISEEQARDAYIQPVTLDVREQDRMIQRQVYMGAVFQYGDEYEVVNVIEPGDPLEYIIASTIRKMTTPERQTIGFLQGRGQPSLEAMVEVYDALQHQYEIVEVTGIDTAGIDSSLAALAIVAPRQTFSEDELIAIDQFIMGGGKVLFALNRLQPNLAIMQTEEVLTGLERLLEAYHTPLGINLVRDVSSGYISVGNQQLNFPYLPIVTSFSDHLVTRSLESVLFNFVSTVDEVERDSTVQKTVLARSSVQSAAEGFPVNIDPYQNWSQLSFNGSGLPVAVLSQGTFKSAFRDSGRISVDRELSVETSIIVIGDGDFAVTGEDPFPQRLPLNNRVFFHNSIDFLADDTGLITLRSREVSRRPLRVIDDNLKMLLKILNVAGPITLVLLYGGYRYQRRRKQRKMWIEGGV